MRRSDQAESFQFGSRYGALRSAFQKAHGGKGRRILAFEIDAARHARGPRSAGIGAAAPAQSPDPFGGAFRHRHPGLMIPHTGRQDQKGGGLQALQHSSAEVVQLDQLYGGTLGPYDQIVLALDPRIQQERRPAPASLPTNP